MPMTATGYAGGCVATDVSSNRGAMKQRRLIRGAISGKVGFSPQRRGVGTAFAGAAVEARNGEVEDAIAPLFAHQFVDNRLVGVLAGRSGPSFAADKTVKIGISLPFTGADAHDAELIKDGAMLAIDEANAAGGVAGYKIDVLQLDDGTATAGQYDPAQAATNARKMVSDDSVVAAIGPQMSGSGKAMAPILSQGDLATITPSSTNPDITDPKFAAQYRPGGKADLFPHGHDRRLPGPEHGELFRRYPEGEVGLCARRQRRLWRRASPTRFRRRPKSAASRCSAATS